MVAPHGGSPDALPTVDAAVPTLAPPAWAVLQRRLFDVLDRSVEPFLEKYTRPDGTLIWRDELPGRDGADDGYESFHNWPLLYALGGGDHLLALGARQWEAVTRQFTAYGQVYREFERGYDWFHQGESYIYFYYLCLADAARREHLDRARRFADLYTGEDPAAPNYDPALRLIRAPHNGSGGPRWGLFDGEPSYGWSASMARYGLPYDDVPGVTSYDDLRDPALARRMGEVMQARMGDGDVPANLAATSLVTNAYLLTGEERYRRWVLDYVEAWIERARANGGLLPDSVGLSGRVGERNGGKWWGGLYGWTWPHGFYNVCMAAIVGAANACLLTGDLGYLDLPRWQIDRVLDLGELRDGELAVPYRHGDAGWFEYQPMSLLYPVAVWNLSQSAADWERIERLRQGSRADWRAVLPFRNKHDDGHEGPWLRFLVGDNPTYPEEVLRESYGQVCWRLDLIRADRADLSRVNVHHWQQLNPVLTEGLVQLTLGAPQVVYNGGLLHARVRYFDLSDRERRRPGLPADVAALVEKLEGDRTVLTLVNTSPLAARELVVQAGAFAEHRFGRVSYEAPSDAAAYPGRQGRYAPPELTLERRTLPVDGSRLRVRLPPGTQVRLELETARLVGQPTYAPPW